MYLTPLLLFFCTGNKRAKRALYGRNVVKNEWLHHTMIMPKNVRQNGGISRDYKQNQQRCRNGQDHDADVTSLLS